jgi:segregation and condensation protein B
MEPEVKKNTAALEALLFVHGEPLTLKKIAAVLELEKDALLSALEMYAAELETESRGITIFSDVSVATLRDAGDWENVKIQLATKPAFGALATNFLKEELEEDLTPASIEALSLILYLGPIPRSRLDYLRGVNSSFILKNLMMRGLVERVPDPARPSVFLYRASLETMKHLGVRAAADLPEYEKFRSLAAAGEAPQVPQ